MDENFTWLNINNSSAIIGVGYSTNGAQRLRVKFKATGRDYENGLPMDDAKSVAEAIQQAESPGKYFNSRVAGVYAMRAVK